MLNHPLPARDITQRPQVIVGGLVLTSKAPDLAAEMVQAVHVDPRQLKSVTDALASACFDVGISKNYEV